MVHLLDSFEAHLVPVVEAIGAVVEDTADSLSEGVRQASDAILNGLGSGIETLGITVAQLEALTDSQREGLLALTRAAQLLRAATAGLVELVPALEDLKQQPLARKCSPESRAIVIQAAQQAAKMASAIVNVFAVMRPLVAGNAVLTDELRRRFKGWFDAGAVQ
jgi:hypothetical protein